MHAQRAPAQLPTSTARAPLSLSSSWRNKGGWRGHSYGSREPASPQEVVPDGIVCNLRVIEAFAGIHTVYPLVI